MTQYLEPAPIVELVGRESVAFAQAQFTNAVDALAVGDWHWSAWLDAAGRARCVFALLRPHEERLLMWMPLGDAGAIAGELRRFVFRAKVRVAAADGWHLFGAEATDALPSRLHGTDAEMRFDLPGAVAAGAPRRTILRRTGAEAVDAGRLAGWRCADIAAALPWIAPAVAGRFAPQALDLERIDAIRFDKGCYPGQEVAARLHFRGGNKRRCVRLALEGTAIPLPGSGVLGENPDGPHGEFLYAAASSTGVAALAVVPDALLEAGPLRVEGDARPMTVVVDPVS